MPKLWHLMGLRTISISRYPITRKAPRPSYPVLLNYWFTVYLIQNNMERRDFVKNTALAALGASFVGPLGALAADKVTHLESEDLTLLPKAKDDYALHFMAIGDW